jgi:hypothetical protein
MVAIGSLLVIMAIGLLITRVATVILEATGLSRQAARFQARSAFTGSGFTTRESEEVVDHPVRRKVIMWLMLLGNAGIVAAAGSLIIGFRGGNGDAWRVLELGLGLLALVSLSRSRWVDRHLSRGIRRLLRRYTDLPTRDLGSLMGLAGDYSVSELVIEDDDWAANRTLGELELREEGIVVLGVTRRDGHYLGAPTGRTALTPGDTLIVYGREGDLCELDHRPAGSQGAEQHDAAVRRLDQQHVVHQ